MTNQHPITPPPNELVHQWHKEACKDPYHGGTFFESKTLKHIATKAAQWGADQELEACYQHVDWVIGGLEAKELRAARRPKLPNLNSIALQMLGTIERDAHYIPEITDTIRRALEALDD
jgi:hypothetical protein